MLQILENDSSFIFRLLLCPEEVEQLEMRMMKMVRLSYNSKVASHEIKTKSKNMKIFR